MVQQECQLDAHFESANSLDVFLLFSYNGLFSSEWIGASMAHSFAPLPLINRHYLETKCFVKKAVWRMIGGSLLNFARRGAWSLPAPDGANQDERRIPPTGLPLARAYDPFAVRGSLFHWQQHPAAPSRGLRLSTGPPYEASVMCSGPLNLPPPGACNTLQFRIES